MNSETYNPSKIIYILIGLASFIIIVAGFRAAAPIIVPFMMALFFSLIIFLSLIFWGWILGPVGMFLSVPLTIVLKIVFEHFESTRWLSILLGPDEFPIGKQNTITLKKENLKIETETETG
jgi:predicted PurR-regulated permease PerM